MKREKTFSSTLEALDFIDKLAKRKPKVTGFLSNRLLKGEYRKNVLISGTFEWTVKYETKGHE